MTELTREDLIALVRRLMTAAAETEEEEDEMVMLLEKNVPHPAPTDLIFYNSPELSAEQVVDIAIAYQPIILGHDP